MTGSGAAEVRPTSSTNETSIGLDAIGGPETVRARIDAFVAETGADELMITAQMHDHVKRLRSLELLAGLISR